MIIYRVEGPDGLGPYSSSWHGHSELHQAHGGLTTHPDPWGDGLGNFMGEYHSRALFGFESEAKMLEWFSGWMDELLAAGFRVVRYEATRYQTGASGHQTVFDRVTATRLDRPDVDVTKRMIRARKWLNLYSEPVFRTCIQNPLNPDQAARHASTGS